MTEMILHDYFRSTASYRVRIALAYKGISFAKNEIHLVKDGGQQHSDAYQGINPQELVPALETEQGVLTQSLAIIPYLEQQYPEPRLYPEQAFHRAKIESLALLVACDVHPLNNLSVLQYLKGIGVDDEQKTKWYHHWLKRGFTAFETRLQQDGLMGRFCYQDELSIADVCLVPQIYNAERFEFDMKPYKRINAIYQNCLAMDAIQQAYPKEG